MEDLNEKLPEMERDEGTSDELCAYTASYTISLRGSGRDVELLN